MLLYARTGTGYRAGGVNNGTVIAGAPNPLQPTYGNEETTSYEVGLKSRIGSRAEVNALVARLEASKAQVKVAESALAS